jgi:DNA repair protein SbcD/Mre11
MKIIHTSDWHLGQKFLSQDRAEEHELALSWLLHAIQQQQAEMLIVAGDIFDIGNPPNYARRMYYRFLTSLLGTSCRHIIITGGNHDSPAMLNAPRELLQALNIHVVGAAAEDLAEELVECRSPEGELEAIVAAVPFLRDRDLHASISGEGGMERVERVSEGIRRHYEAIAALLAERYPDAKVPIIATGHLYATGALASAKQDNIYIGNTENIAADQFPAIFDYVALGHIHRPQAVGGLEHVRYSGSLIPLSFSETKDDKSVYLLEFEGKTLKAIQALALPVFRRLKSIQGPLQKVEEDLQRFAAKNREGLRPWVEAIVETDRIIPQLDRRLQELTEEMYLDLLKIRIAHDAHPLAAQSAMPELGDLDETEVFAMKCHSLGSPPEEMEELMAAFRELREAIMER